jgi:hypothetical protein
VGKALSNKNDRRVRMFTGRSFLFVTSRTGKHPGSFQNFRPAGDTIADMLQDAEKFPQPAMQAVRISGCRAMLSLVLVNIG